MLSRENIKNKIKSIFIVMAILLAQASYAHDQRVVKKIYIKSPVKRNTLMLFNSQKKGSKKIYPGLGYQRMIKKDVRVIFTWTSDKTYTGGVGFDW